MLIITDPHSGIPVYRQVMDQIRFHVASGMLRPGDELPSTRQLSAQLGVNPMTVSKAFSLLEKEGAIERRPGRPSVVSARGAESLRADRLEQLRQSLAPSVTVIRQLEIEAPDALELLRQMLAGESESRENEEKPS
ncbi:MAG: GntR family transcriptional regulator [Planctomycetota bacterium]|jgi:GntR family transcriptional regulator